MVSKGNRKDSFSGRKRNRRVRPLPAHAHVRFLAGVVLKNAGNLGEPVVRFPCSRYLPGSLPASIARSFRLPASVHCRSQVRQVFSGLFRQYGGGRSAGLGPNVSHPKRQNQYRGEPQHDARRGNLNVRQPSSLRSCRRRGYRTPKLQVIPISATPFRSLKCTQFGPPNGETPVLHHGSTSRQLRANNRPSQC